MSLPLSGTKVIEFAGIGPGPHACMMLADLGAEVIRLVRPGAEASPGATSHTLRGRLELAVDLKDPEGLARVLDLVDAADVLIEGFRPGVMERLGLGPDVCLARNPRLVFGRMTGWGQTGPLATTAGHDINYISLTGALHAIGTPGHPVPPLNLVGDYGGGSMLLVNGVLAALFARERTGSGQVVDAAMVDGASMLLQGIVELRDTGQWNDTRANNILDGAAPQYRTYECSDGRFVAVGAIEPQFWAILLDGLGVPADLLPDRDDPANWDAWAKVLADRFVQEPRDHWAELFAGTDACLTPVLDFVEATGHPHVAARGSLRADGASVIAAPAPRFSMPG